MPMREPITERIKSLLVNTAQSIEMVALDVGAHGLTAQEAKLRAIAKMLRDRKTQ